MSFLPGGDNYNEDHNPAIGGRDNNNNIELIDNNSTNEPLENIRINEPVDDSGIKSGSDCSADLKPRPALPDSPFSTPVCGMSSGHVGPPPSKWRQPFPEDISAATNWGSPVSSRPQRDIGGKARDMSGIGFSRRCKVICTINEGDVENRRRGLVAKAEGTNSFDTTVVVVALAALPPGLASPPTLRSRRLADSSSGEKWLPAESTGHCCIVFHVCALIMATCCRSVVHSICQKPLSSIIEWWRSYSFRQVVNPSPSQILC